MADTVMIQVRFSKPTQYGSYEDALYFSLSEYATKSPADIDALKQARVDNYINAVKNPPAPVQLTKADIQAQIDATSAQIVDMQSQVVKLTADKVKAPVSIAVAVSDVVVGG